jgi:hypothetical protein
MGQGRVVFCKRHNAIATNTEHGIPFCLKCFGEARIEAVAAALERSITVLRAHSVTDRRLEGRK